MPLPLITVDLKGLECFRAIMDSGSATADARELNMTQPAVSRSLGILEKWIGFALFIRSKGRLITTSEALSFYKEVKITLQSIERLSKLAMNIHNANFGELKIVSPPSFAEGMLSAAIDAFIGKHPNIKISLDSQSVKNCIGYGGIKDSGLWFCQTTH
jgi:DNA-binding transcriptional LysR family regulator